jgi:4-amino-4-deoxy-L-arabinose transferase-like glycosyltransferase
MKISPKYFPLLLLLLACFIRLVYFYQFQGNPFSSHLPNLWDQSLYHKGAQAFIEGDLFALAPDQPNQQSPFYQYFLGIVYFFFGVKLTAAWVVQLILGVASTFLVYVIAGRYISQGYAFMAAVFFTFYGGNWFYECTLYRASLVTLLILLTCLLILLFAEKPSIGLLIGSALSLSFLTQSRSNLILFVPIALVYLWRKVFSLNSAGKKWLVGYLVIFFLASLPLLIWVKQIHGEWGLYDQTGGENIYLANSPDYSSRSVIHDKKYRNLLESERLGTLTGLKLILNDISEHPLDIAKVYLKKVYYYFNNYEVPTTHNYYLSSELSPLLKWGSIPFGVIAVLGIIGFFLSWKNWKKLTLLHAFFLANLLAYLPFFIFSRYRLSMVPFLCIFSAFSLQIISQRFRENDLRALSLITISVLVLGWFVKTAPLPEGKIRILDFINLSSAYLNNHIPEDDSKALNYLERSWELSRTLPANLRNSKITRKALSHFYHKKSDSLRFKGDTIHEELALLRALSFDFSSPLLHELYSRNLIQKGQSKKALFEVLIALGLNPSSFELNLLAGEIYATRLSNPLWGLYHLLLALRFSDQPISLSVNNLVQELQTSLNFTSLSFDPEILEPKVRNLLSKEIQTTKIITTTSTLPAESFNWKTKELYNYQLGLHQYLIFNRGVNTSLIYFQLGKIELNFFNNDNSAFYYFQKSWDSGLKTQQLASLLNDLSEKLSTRSISEITQFD